MTSTFDPDEMTWIVVFGFIASFMAAFGIGANDCANAYATSVGSGALTVKQASLCAVIFEFLGATLLGTNVTKTIRKGIADVDCFVDDPGVLMWGMLSVLISVAFWLILASKLELPVSTTHSCIGGLMGIALVKGGQSCVIWSKENDEFPYIPKGFAAVVISWVLSPVLSGIFSAGLFGSLRCFVLRSKNAFERSVKVYPVLVFLCFAIICAYMLIKGVKSSDEIKNLEFGEAIGISCGVGAGVALLSTPLYLYLRKRILNGDFKPAVIRAQEEAASTTTTSEPKEVEAAEKGFMGRMQEKMAYGLNVNIHDSIGKDKRTTTVHDNAEKFDANAEAYFTYLQIISAIFDSLAHGANDVANAMGPFATIYMVWHTGVVSSKSEMGDNKYWILGLGGVGIGVGLLLYGYQILRAIGVKLAVITPSRGFSIEMGSSLVVIIGSKLGLPLSTTHCQVGATTGVALLDGARGVNTWVLGKAVFGWVFTCVFVGAMSAAIFAIGINIPTVTTPGLHQCDNFYVNYTLAPSLVPESGYAYKP